MTDVPARDVPVRDAATVLLLRDASSGIEVWLLTRSTQMVFAAGMAVFPGGRVDSSDAGLPFVPGAEHDVAARFDCPPGQARALLGAAVRETFEETGVLLAVPSVDIAASRADVEAGTVSFGDLLRSAGSCVDVSALQPWSRWVTPPGEVRRYDTRFFVCAIPARAEPQDVTTESSSAAWFDIAAALDAAASGELGMMPPTIATLGQVAGFGSVAEVLAAAPTRSLAPIMPAISRNPDGSYLATLPDGTAFPLPRAFA